MSKDLHDQIINIACRRADDTFLNQASRLLYKEGHRDARHDATELALAASGGNAAPPDACPVAITDSSAPNGIKWYVKPPDHLKNGMNLYFVPAKIMPASAPNAALVAALEDAADALENVEADRFNVDMDEVSSAASSARAALSAAGQEVDHG